MNKFEFKALPYSYDALEPFIDELTLEILMVNIIKPIMTISLLQFRAQKWNQWI